MIARDLVVQRLSSRRAEEILRRVFGQVVTGWEFRLWDGTRVTLGDGAPVCTVVVHRPETFIRLMRDPTPYNFAETYAESALDLEGDLFAAMVNRVTLPMEAMVARSSDESVEDPIASLKACAVSALMRTATDPQVQRVFDVVTHKCEYLGDMAGVNGRISSIQKGCVDRSEQAIRNAIKRGLLPAHVNPRLAAVGLDAMIFGLISNWLANSGYLPLERQAEAMIDLYLDGLRGRPVTRARAGRAPRKAYARRRAKAA